MLPHVFGTFGRRSTLPPAAILGAAAVSIGAGDRRRGGRPRGPVPRLALQLRRADHLRGRAGGSRPPALHRARPASDRIAFPGTSGSEAATVPVAALVGIPLTFALWVVSFATHDAARIGGPAWLALGAVLYVVARVRRGAGLTASGRGGDARSRPAERGRVRADPRPGQARPDRRGDARDRDQARRGARRDDLRAACDPRAARPAARRRAAGPGGACERVADRREAARRTSTA